MEPKDAKPVRVVPYDPRWPDIFRLEAQHLSLLLGPGGVSIHHIGSTSVAGLCAKPVVDILIEASGLATIDHAAPELERRGYVAKGEYGVAGRRYFSGLPMSSNLKVHLHAFRRGSPHVTRHLQFRDYLRAHPAVAARYCALKQRLAADHPENAAAYQAGKVDFMRRIETQAATWISSLS